MANNDPLSAPWWLEKYGRDWDGHDVNCYDILSKDGRTIASFSDISLEHFSAEEVNEMITLISIAPEMRDMLLNLRQLLKSEWGQEMFRLRQAGKATAYKLAVEIDALFEKAKICHSAEKANFNWTCKGHWIEHGERLIKCWSNCHRKLDNGRPDKNDCPCGHDSPCWKESESE